MPKNASTAIAASEEAQRERAVILSSAVRLMEAHPEATPFAAAWYALCERYLLLGETSDRLASPTEPSYKRDGIYGGKASRWFGWGFDDTDEDQDFLEAIAVELAGDLRTGSSHARLEWLMAAPQAPLPCIDPSWLGTLSAESAG